MRNIFNKTGENLKSTVISVFKTIKWEQNLEEFRR